MKNQNENGGLLSLLTASHLGKAVLANPPSRLRGAFLWQLEPEHWSRMLFRAGLRKRSK